MPFPCSLCVASTLFWQEASWLVAWLSLTVKVLLRAADEGFCYSHSKSVWYQRGWEVAFPPHFLSLCARRLTFHTSANVQSLLERMANRIALFETSVFYYIHIKADGEHFIVCQRVESFSIWNVKTVCQSDVSPGGVSSVFLELVSE